MLHLGPALAIEDIGGPGGVRVLGQALAPGVPATVSLNTVIELGANILVV